MTRPSVPLSLIRQVALAAAPGAISLAVGEPSHAVPAAVRDAIAAAVAAGDFGYTPNAGRADLRQAVARRRPAHGGEADSTLVTVGSQEALALAVFGLVGPGDEVVIPDIGYPAYETLPRLAGTTGVRAPLAAVEAAITPRTRMLIVGSPANPTGEVLAAERFRQLATLAEERRFWLLSDEVYEELWLDAPPSYPSGPRVLHVGGISKSLALTGLRLGWLVAPPDVTQQLLGLHQNLVTCAPSLAQVAALAGLALPAAEMEAIRDGYRRRWATMRNALAGIRDVTWREPQGAFYCFADFRRRVASTTQLAFDLARQGEVLVVPGEAFGPAGAGWLRLTFAAPEEAIREGVARLAAALQ
ncbi:MAG TPA: pyridoxal phosphate-dependent aminotransferase [Thermoanaerobaculia bacterium]|jgi:aspartate/methionine/tyrosine aminotransferase|nr:pyridoxal phosphate-dependent aminotransferase [Thermoanaerobaculia bacterium]